MLVLRNVVAALSLLLGATGLAIVLARLLTLATRLHANENFVGGIWIALAHYAGRGVLYPPLFDGEHYGGTRYMPLPIVLHAAASVLSGEYLVSGRLLGVLYMAGLLVLLGWILVRIGLPAIPALVLSAFVLTTEVAWIGAAGLRFEALPTGLSLAAVEVARSRPGRRWLAIAATLCCAALFAKLSAVVAPVTIVAWLAWRRRADLGPFLLVFAATSALALVLSQLASGGRMLPVVTETILAQPPSGGLMGGISALVSFAATMARPILLLVPLAVAGLLLAALRDGPSIYDVALGVALASTVVVLSDRAAGYNHLLDLVVLVTVVAAELWVRSSSSEHKELAAIVPVALALAVSLVAVGWLSAHLPAAARSWIRGAQATDAAALLARELGPGVEILSEDPYVPVALGQDPVVLDPYLLARLSSRQPGPYGALVERVERAEFAVVVLMRRLDARAAPRRYGERIFGAGVYRALQQRYRFDRLVGGRYFLYVPR